MKDVDLKPKIELRTGEIEELLGRPPSGIVRWGITIFFGIIVAALVFCSYVKYPKTVTATVLITTENPATWIVAKNNGKIDSILVHDNDSVHNGQILAAISNPCRLSDALILKDYLKSLQNFIYTMSIDSIRFCDNNFILGELQSDYSQLNTLLGEYGLFCREKSHNIAHVNMLKEKNEQEQYLDNLRRQKNLCLQNEHIITNKLKRDSTLFSQKIIQISDYENTKQQLIYGRMESSRVDISINATTLNIIQLESRIQQTSADYKSKMSDYKNAISSIYEQLLAKLAIWENHYVLKAPTDGIVNFSNVWSSNQLVNIGDKVFAVLADVPGKITGKCNIPVANIGKMAKNQSVVIKLDSYPFLEFGVLNGTISNMSKLPVNQVANAQEVKFVVAEVVLEQPLITSYHKRVAFNGELTGIAEITTEDMTLIEHFISPLKYLFNK